MKPMQVRVKADRKNKHNIITLFLDQHNIITWEQIGKIPSLTNRLLVTAYTVLD
jgi:hypothetical protein